MTEAVPVSHGATAEQTGGASAEQTGAATTERTVAATAEPSGAPGRVVIANRVLERIATHAVTEVDEIGGTARRLLGVPLGRDSAGGAARVDAHIDGRLATLRMAVSVAYPAPVRQVARQLRDLVTTRLGELTGLEIRQVDIDITTLTPPESRGVT